MREFICERIKSYEEGAITKIQLIKEIMSYLVAQLESAENELWREAQRRVRD